MTFVDTSVWTPALRDGACPEARELRRLLDANAVALPIPVRIEILGGAGRADRVRLARLLSALPTSAPTAVTWQTMERWAGEAADAGRRFGVAGLLIAAIATENGGAVWSNDTDFRRMRELGFVRLHEPPDIRAAQGENDAE